MSRVVGYRPSNGTEGLIFWAHTCDRCSRDHQWHSTETGDSCPIIMDALAGEHAYPNEDGPPQWWRDGETGETGCSEFEGPCPCDAA